MPAIGTNAHPLWQMTEWSADDATMFAVCRANGMKVLRIDVPLWAYENTWFSKRLMRIVDLSVASGVELMLVMDPTSNGVLVPLDTITKATAAVCTIVGDEVVRFEGGNEINLLVKGADGQPLFGKGQTAAEFDTPLMHDWADALKVMQQAMAKANPPPTYPYRFIVTTTSTMFGFLDFMIAQGVKIDRIGYHIYEHLGVDLKKYWNGALPAFNLFDKLRSYGKAIVVGELNAAEIYDRDDPAQAAKSLAALLGQFKAHPQDLDCVCVYMLTDMPQIAGAEGRFGMMRDLKTPKAAMAAMKAAM
jgi:hypothetical protein